MAFIGMKYRQGSYCCEEDRSPRTQLWRNVAIFIMYTNLITRLSVPTLSHALFDTIQTFICSAPITLWYSCNPMHYTYTSTQICRHLPNTVHTLFGERWLLRPTGWWASSPRHQSDRLFHTQANGLYLLSTNQESLKRMFLPLPTHITHSSNALAG